MEKHKTTKTCFVIAPIGDSDSDTRKRSDKVLKHIISPSVEKFGYKPIRADQISEPGIITSQIIQHIVESELVIADLTDKNPNVFYELALRHAIKKPLIQIIKKGDQIPFDVAATRIVHFDIQDLDSVDGAKTEIENQLKTIESGKIDFDNPISVSLDIKMLKESGNPEQRSLADIVEALTELRSSITVIDKRLSSPEGVFPVEYFDNMIHKIYRSRNRDEGMFLYERVSSDFANIREMLQAIATKEIPKKFDPSLINDVIERLENLRYKLKDYLMMGNRFLKG